MKRGVVWLVMLMAASVMADDLEDALAARWRGAAVVVSVETLSDCGGFYTNNEVIGGRVGGDGRRRFAVGEVAVVDKINLKSERFDLYLTLAEPVLLERQDGPFTLYDERECRVQFMTPLSRAAVRGGGVAAVEQAIAPLLTKFATVAEARRAPSWNRRQREELPRDYEVTIARHARWQAEQANAAVLVAQDRAVETATRLLERLHEDGDYLAGFAAGVEAMRSARRPECSSLPSVSFGSAEQKAPHERGGEGPAQRSWQSGFRDGQELAFNLAVAAVARGCLVPVPPAS